MAETIKLRWYAIMIQHILPIQNKKRIAEIIRMQNQRVGRVDTVSSENVELRLEPTISIKAILSQFMVSKRCFQDFREYSVFISTCDVPTVFHARPDHQRCQFMGNSEGIFLKRSVPLAKFRYNSQGNIRGLKIGRWDSKSCTEQIGVMEPVNFKIKRLYFITIKFIEGGRRFTQQRDELRCGNFVGG